MKKLLIVSGMLLSILLSSCRSDRDSYYVVGVSQCSDDLWRQTMNNEMLREASFYQECEIKLDIRSVKDDTQQQIRDIESLIDEGVDLLIISPNESTAITPVVRKAYQKNIPVILVDRKIDTDDYTAYIGADNYQIGKEVGLYVADVLKGRGNVVEIRGRSGSTSDTERHNGFIDGLKDSPDIHIIASERADFLQKQAETQMAKILKQDNRIDLVFAMNDPMALGVHNAVSKYSGKLPFIIGIDALYGEGGGIENIRKGIQDASLIYPTGGDKVIDVAIKILTDLPYSRENILRTAVVDKNNVRIIQLQTDQIFEHQSKLTSMGHLLNKNLTQFSNQRTLFYATIFILVLITILFLVTVIAYRLKSKVNTLLEKQNKEVKRQAEVLTEQKEQLISLSLQLEEATHAKLVFFTNISHEFRTPLTLIIGPIETLLDSDNLTPEQKNLLSLTKRNSKRLMELITQIIEFRSYENGKMQLRLIQSDLRAFLAELNIVFSDYTLRHKINLVFEHDDSSFDMKFDKEKLEKIYFNLLSNAFRHTPEGGLVKVSLNTIKEDGKDKVKLTVFNTGKAIPTDKIKNIFDRFYKVDINDTGTGIGLALTSALIDVHQGNISVESLEGLGTTFTVVLPTEYDKQNTMVINDNYIQDCPINILDIPVTSKEEDILVESSNDTNKPMVLVIEDNPDMQNYLEYILKDEYNLVTANDGESGVKKAIKYIPDAILSDVMMSGKDGFEVCHILKDNMMTSHIPLILLTACSLDEQKALGFESGADAYISKPFNAELLKIRLRKLIEIRKKMKNSFGQNFMNDSKKTSLASMEQKFIDDFRAYVELRMTESEISVDDIAMHLGLSRAQLYRKLKSVTDYSPNELVNIIKLKYAVQLLVNDRKTISEVAYRIGFSSPSYFTKVFKKYYKESPSDFLERTIK